MSGAQGFSRSHRLLSVAEFEAVFANKCAVRTRCFQVLGRPNSQGHARLGMVISKRLLARAVDRNHLRRQIRETFRQMAQQLPALDIVIRPLTRPPAEGVVEDLRAGISGAASKCAAC